MLDARFKTCVPHQAQPHENLQTLEYKTIQDTGLKTKKFEPEYGEIILEAFYTLYTFL